MSQISSFPILEYNFTFYKQANRNQHREKSYFYFNVIYVTLIIRCDSRIHKHGSTYNTDASQALIKLLTILKHPSPNNAIHMGLPH